MNREEACLYDLFLTPGWRERYDQLVDQEFTFPKSGRILDLEAGTGGFAIELARRSGEGTEVTLVPADPELQAIATEKARIGKVANVRFFSGPSELLASSPEPFEVVISDWSLHPWREPLMELADIAQLIRPGGSIIWKLLVQGSFDELFSIFWEALYELNLVEYSSKLERLILARPPLAVFEEQASGVGFRQIRGVISREVLTFADANEFLTSPLISLPFLPYWLGVLPDGPSGPDGPDEQIQRQVIAKIATIIDRERQGGSFEVSVRAALLIARR